MKNVGLQPKQTICFSVVKKNRQKFFALFLEKGDDKKWNGVLDNGLYCKSLSADLSPLGSNIDTQNETWRIVSAGSSKNAFKHPFIKEPVALLHAKNFKVNDTVKIQWLMTTKEAAIGDWNDDKPDEYVRELTRRRFIARYLSVEIPNWDYPPPFSLVLEVLK